MKQSHSVSQLSEPDDQIFNIPSLKNLNFSQNILWDANKKLEEFIDSLGNIRETPQSLEKYENDLDGIQIYQAINASMILDYMKDTIRKMIINKKIKENWNKYDLIILLWLIKKYHIKFNKSIRQYNEFDWKIIAQMIPGKSGEQCMFKWLSLKSNRSCQKLLWTQSEDFLLKKFVIQGNQPKWFEISRKLYHLNQFKIYRTPKQCRQRWGCYLNPLIKKGQWSAIEDYILIKKYLESGRKWSQIIKLLKGRTQNAVKNRFNLLLSKFEKNTKQSQSSIRLYFENYIKQLKEIHEITRQMIEKYQQESEKYKIDKSQDKQVKNEIKIQRSIKSTCQIPQQYSNLNLAIDSRDLTFKKQDFQNLVNYNDFLIQGQLIANKNEQFLQNLDTNINLFENHGQFNMSSDFILSDYDLLE